jgi:hypothetical protein
MSEHGPDLWGVWRNRERIWRNLELPLLAPWRQQSLEPLTKSLTEPLPAGEDSTETMRQVAEQAQSLAFAYVVTEDVPYAEKGLACLDAIHASDARWDFVQHNAMYPEDTADLGTAETTKACANAVSWLWPTLTDAQRADFIAMIAERGGKPIYESAQAGCWWGNALNSNWTAVLNSGLAFAALLRVGSGNRVGRDILDRPMDRLMDRPTGGPGCPAPREALDWLAFARDRTVEMLDLAAEEGAGIEGAGYWLYCFGSLLDIVEAIRNVTGEDLYEHPFWRVCSRFLPHVALPDMSAWVNYADTGYQGLGGSHVFHGVASRARDPFAQWFGNEILRRTPAVSWRSLITYDDTVPEQGPEAEPPCRFFKSIHLASFRSGWDEDATFMFFKGGSNAWSHTHLDLNSFFITAHGERLATEPGPEHYSLAYWHSIQPPVSTAWHNCIVVDGAHQRVPAQYAMSYDLEEAGDCYSRLSDHVSEDWVEMIRGDATTAYGDMLSRAWRDVVYLKPNVFVIFDDLIGHPVRCQRNFEWMLHSECELHETESRVGRSSKIADPAIVDNRPTRAIEARGGKATLRIEPVFPAGWEHKFIEGRTIPYAENKPLHAVSIRPYWHHKWNVNPAKSCYPHWDPRGDAEPLYDNTCQFLTVLTTLKSGAEAPYRLEPIAEGTAKGVRLVGESEQTLVLLNHNRETVDLGDLQTDAEKLVLRVGDGRKRPTADVPDAPRWAMVRGTRLVWNGTPLEKES